MNETQPATREITLAQDVQNIRGWWSAAELIYATHKKDIANYGPVFEEFGKALQTRMAGLDERTRVMIGLWSKVNERLPSHEEQMMRVIANQSKKIEHQQ